MAICNLFNSFTKNTGNFLLFSQYNEDLTKNISMGDLYKVIPSRFVVLDINYENVDKALYNSYNTIEPDSNLNNTIPNYFQNYFENGCAYLKNPNNFSAVDIPLVDQTWTPNSFKNMFWNSLYNINMISKVEVAGESQYKTFFIKEAKYIGDINLHSYNEKDGTGYSEIYCYIPNESKGYTYGSAKDVPVNLLCDCEPYNEYEVTQAINKVIEGKYNNTGISDCYCGCESIDNDTFQQMLDEFGDFDSDKPINIKEEIIEEDKINDVEEIINNMAQYGCYINPKQYIEGFDGIYDYSLDDKYGSYNSEVVTPIRTYYPNSSFINPNSWMTDKQEIKDLEYYKFNTIIVLYDIYSNNNIIYENVPMGIYFTGLFDKNSVISNEVVKYITNENIYNDGTSYGLRICSKFITSPNSSMKTIDISLEDQNYSAFCQAMTNMSETISKMNDLLNTNINFQQNIKDELSMFKNNKTNTPYIKEVDGEDFWFINGKLLTSAAKIPMSLMERLNVIEGLLGINNYEENEETILPAIQEEYIDEKIENTFLNIKN